MTVPSLFRSFLPLFSNDPIASRLDHPMDRMWRRFLDWETGNGGAFVPATNVVEKPDSYVVQAELPGVKKEDVKVTLADNLLTVRGEKKSETKRENENYRCVESTYGSFERSMTLPNAAPDQDVDAKLADGMLTITVKKRKDAKQKEIAVK